MVNKTVRKRGGASLVCPECGSDSKVKETRRYKNHTRRIRVCVKTKCHKTFETREIYGR
jgi:hypothetical protein